MSVIVHIGTTKFLAYGEGAIPPGFVLYEGAINYDPDDPLELLMVWETDNIRPMNTAELLAKAKVKKIKLLQQEATGRAKAIYPFITHPSFYNFAEDLYLSIQAGSRNALSGRLLQFKGVKDVFDTKKAEINALATVTDIGSYDLQAGWLQDKKVLISDDVISAEVISGDAVAAIWLDIYYRMLLVYGDF